MLVLPVLMSVFLGLATVGRLFVAHVAVGEAAQQGIQAWETGQSSAAAEARVAQTLAGQGLTGASVTASQTGTVRTLTVAVPVTLWNNGKAATLTASRTFATLPSGTQSPQPVPHGGGGGAGGTAGYHHFPMW